MLSIRSVFPSVIKIAAVVALSAVALCASVPRGWYLAGSKPQAYQTGVDETQYNGHRVAYLKATTATEGFGTLMQDFRADDYAGKRVRFSAMLKAESVADWAGLWMRVDKFTPSSNEPKILAFDNMQDRPVKGTEDWKHYDVVLDVPKDASAIAFGLLLAGSGNVMMSDAKMEIVGLDVPVTAKQTAAERSHQTAPTNLDFEP